MKTVSGCLRSGVLALVIMLAVPLAAWSYHFELVSIDGSVQEAPVFIGTGITSDFVYGPVISSEIDAYGERTASTDLLFNGNTCTFIAMTDVMTDATATLLQSYAAVSASFYVRVVADPGDPATVGIVAEWSSTTHSEYYDTYCYSYGNVAAGIRVNGLLVLDMSRESNSPDAAGTIDLGIVPDGSIISYGRYAESDFVAAAIGSSVMTIGTHCASSASASNSFTLTLNDVPGDPENDMDISCSVTTTADPSKSYTYVLRNTTSAPLTLDQFYLGTMSLDPSSYTNWVMPAGFTPVVADWTTLQSTYGASVMSTTGKWFTSGTIPVGSTMPSAGGVLWYGSITIGAGETVTFGFDNYHQPWNMEWFAEHPDASNSSQGYPGYPIAGPLGTYSDGFVFGPGDVSISTESATWGKIKSLYGE